MMDGLYRKILEEVVSLRKENEELLKRAKEAEEYRSMLEFRCLNLEERINNPRAARLHNLDPKKNTQGWHY